MPITAQSIVDTATSALDAEGSDYYTFDRDFKPAINDTLDWVTTAINYNYGAGKIGESAFQDLLHVRVFIPSKYNRISFDSATLGHDVWTIMAVYPEAEVETSGTTPTSGNSSSYSAGKTYLDSDYSAKRLTLEEWSANRNNPFAMGNDIYADCEGLKSYAYKTYANYESSVFSLTVPEEIEMRPSVKDTYVGVAYAKVPDQVSVVGDNIEFPATIRSLFVKKVLDFISIKQGDNKTMETNANEDMQLLINALS